MKKILFLIIIIFFISFSYAESGIISINILPRCSLDLKPGWNLVSICINKTGNVEEVFNYNLTRFRFILRWKWNGNNSEFEVYSPRAVINPFNSTQLNESYFILVDNEILLGYSGKVNEDMEINMYKGWCALSWPYEFSINITKYFNPEKHRFLMKWDKQKQEFKIYSPRAVINPFTEILTGEGQFIYSYFNHTIYYNRSKLEK